MAGAAQVLISVAINGAGATAGAAQANKALDSVATRAQTVGSRLTSAGVRMDRAGRTLTRNLTLPVLGAAAASVKMAFDFDRSLAQIDALVGASKKDMALYREEVMKLSGETAKSPLELGEALYFVTSSGFEGASALKVLEASAKAAAAGLGETGTVADAVTSAVNAYGEKNLSAMKATDILTAAVREGKVEGDAFAQSIGRVIPLASEMGIEFDQVAGNLAAMSLSGLDASEAATALRGIMASIIKPTEQAREAFKEVGISVEDFRNLVKSRGVLPALLDLKGRIGDNVDMWGRLFPNVRALTGALNLNGKNAEKNVDIMAALAQAVGDTDEAFEKTKDSDAWQMAKRLNDLKVAAVELGENLIPIALDIAEAVSGLAKSFTELDESTQKWLLLAAIGGGPALRLGGAALRLGGWLARGGVGAAGAGAAGGGVGAAGGIGLAAAAPVAIPAALAIHGLLMDKAAADERRRLADETERATESAREHGLASEVSAKALMKYSEKVAFLRENLEAVIANQGREGKDFSADQEQIERAEKELSDYLATLGVTNDAAKNFTDLQNRSRDLSEGQSVALLTLLDKFGKLGVALEDNEKQTIGNLLAVGAFDKAMENLNDAFDKGVKKLDGGKKALGEFGGSADLQKAKIISLSESINKIPTPKEIKIRADTIQAREALAAFIAQVRNTHLTMDLNLNAGGPMGAGVAPDTKHYVRDAGGTFQLPKAPGAYMLPFSKGAGAESVTFSGLGRSGAGRPPIVINIRADSMTDGRKLARFVEERVVAAIDSSEDNYQRESAARGRR